MSDLETTHYYPIGRAIGYFGLGGLLLAVVLAVSFAGSFLWVPIGGAAMALVAMWLGLRSIADRKKYPMTLAGGHIRFYVRKKAIQIPVDEIVAVFYNTKGIDKRASLKKRSGEIVDIPVAYGLNDLVMKLGRRYGIPTSV